MGRSSRNKAATGYKTNELTLPFGKNSGVFRLDIIFNCHISKFAGVKNVAAFLAFHEFHVFFAGHDAHARMSTDFFHSHCVGEMLRGWCSTDWIHIRSKTAGLTAPRSRILGYFYAGKATCQEFSGIARALFGAISETMDENYRNGVVAENQGMG